jgi:hypothetical protein
VIWRHPSFFYSLTPCTWALPAKYGTKILAISPYLAICAKHNMRKGGEFCYMWHVNTWQRIELARH